MADIHLVTILYNSADGLPDFLASLRAQQGCDWRLHVIDNASPDASAAIVQAAADERITLYRNARNLGFARAANQGLRAGVAEGAGFLVLINNDTLLPPDLLRQMLDARAQTGAEVITPRVMRREDPSEAWYAGGSLDFGWVFMNRHAPYDPAAGTEPRTVDFAPGCCLGLTRAVLERAGLLDESFFVYWEDTDFCLRLRRMGVPIFYLPAISLLHEGGSASGGESSPGFNRLFYRSYMQILRKHFGRWVALRTMARVMRRENARPGRRAAHLRLLFMAMLRGLLAPLRPPPRLDDGAPPPRAG